MSNHPIILIGSRTTKGQRYNQATYNKKTHVQMTERDREDAEAAAQFAAHVSLYHERVRKYMEREIERQKQCGRTDITDALVRIERQFAWDDGDSDDDSGPTYEWENERHPPLPIDEWENARHSAVYDMVVEFKCWACGGPLERRGGTCWNKDCPRCPLNAANLKYTSIDGKKVGEKRKHEQASSGDSRSADEGTAVQAATKMFDYQLLAPIYFLGVPKPIHFLPVQSKSTNFLQISEDKNDSAEKMEVDGENTADLEDERILPHMRKLEDLKPEETKANEEGDEGVRRRRGSRSNTAALQKELEEAKKPKKRLSLREKIDYMANVEKL